MKLHVLLPILLLVSSLNLKAQDRKDLLSSRLSEVKLEEVLVKDNSWIPFPKEYSDRTGWDTFFGSCKDSLIKDGEKYLNYQWNVVKTSYYLAYDRKGEISIMQSPFSKNLQAIASLMGAELAEGKGRFIDDIIDGVMFTCEMTSWAHSAHIAVFSALRSAVPDEREFIVELTQGDVSQLMSWVYYYFHQEFDKISPIFSRRLKTEITKREIDAYLANDNYWWMGFHTPKGQVINNWNPWCNSNALLTFMLVEDNFEKKVAGIRKAIISTDKYLDWVKDDGACEEGATYWEHANGRMHECLRLISLFTAGKIDLLSSNAMFRKMGEYVLNSDMGNGWMVNFADAGPRTSMDPVLLYRYAQSTGSQPLKAYSIAKQKEQGYRPTMNVNFFDAIEEIGIMKEMEQETASPVNYSPFVWYDKTEVCYIRNNNDYFLAAKGGTNGESHNHNDIGSFIFAVGSVPLIIDTGVEGYTKKTFSSERYTIWTMQSLYHNVPEINGVAQKDGRSYHASNVKADAKKKSLALDICKAYPGATTAKSWKRTLMLDGKGLHINDSFEIDSPKTSNRLFLMTWGEQPVVENGRIIVEAKDKKAAISYDSKRLDATVEIIDLKNSTLSGTWGKRIFRIVLTARQLEKQGSYKVEITKL